MDFDLILRGGSVLDPGQGLEGRMDVAFAHGRVAAIGPDLSVSASEVVGNAYADEILWEARVKPRRTASLMTAEEIAGVHAAIPQVVSAAVDHLRTVMDGRLQGEPRRDFFHVHHRSRKPCPRCGARIAFESLRDRPTNWCPACQP